MKGNFWERFRFKYRVSVQNENTLSEVWHIRLSQLGVVLSVVFLSIFTFFLFAVLIWFTPIRRYLPGYDENVRQTLVEETIRIDSLRYQMALQRDYTDVLRTIVSGEIEGDSLPSLDSIALLQREELMKIRSAATEQFEAEYEAKERDNMTLFEGGQAAPTYTLYRPARGSIEQHFDAAAGQLDVQIRVPRGESVVAVLAGTVVYLTPSLEHGYVMMIQHAGEYLSVYKNITKPLKRVGEQVMAGESVAFGDEDRALQFQLWQAGVVIDPEEVIVF